MPVLTYDITFGTRKVKYLNLSHNAITDLRKGKKMIFLFKFYGIPFNSFNFLVLGVLGNLTSLETLDMSFNEIADLMAEPNIFNLPENLTTLLLNNNKLVRIPGKCIEKVQNLTNLDLRNNNFAWIEPEIIDKVKKGMNLYFEGNPLKCDCNIRPLTHFLATMTYPADFYQNIKCAAPKHIEGYHLYDAPDEYLNCMDNVTKTQINSAEGNDFDILPDIRFRDVL